MDLDKLSDDDLQHLKELNWDDWNFGSGKKTSLELVEQIEEEQEQRKHLSLQKGLVWHAPDSPPQTPIAGDAYFKTADNTAWLYDGNGWVQFAGLGK
jgi:hypothetical protein